MRIGVDELRRSIVVVVMDLKILVVHSEMKPYLIEHSLTHASEREVTVDSREAGPASEIYNRWIGF